MDCFSVGIDKSKNILVFSHWPCIDENAGGKRIYEILKILNHKYNIYLITDNFYQEKYAKLLKENGIKFYCRKAGAGFDPYLQLMHSKDLDFEFCYFAWYTFVVNYFTIVKNVFPNIKTIIDSVDVHWIREQREGIGTFTKKELEKEAYESCDTTIAVSHVDRQIIEKECHINNIRVIPTIHEEKIKQCTHGNDILYIGGFLHSPNIIAAIRSAYIYKQFIAESKQNCKLYIIGSNPPNEIKSIANDNIIVTGGVSDYEMTEYFKKAKTLIVPLTFGAGIKGKICEAIMHKVPVISTLIGSEGLDLNNYEDYFNAETDREFIYALKNLYSLSKTFVEKITDNAFNKTKLMLSKESARSTLDYILNSNRHIVISIITYRNIELLHKCINSLIKHTTYKNLTIVITDNSSEEAVHQMVKNFSQNNKHLDIRYKSNKENQFFSKPNNEIIKQFPESDIILLNDDTVIKIDSWIEILQNTAYISGDISCCGGKAISSENKISEAGSYIYNNGLPFNIGYNQDIDSNEYNKKIFVNYCAGSLLYMKRKAINDIGLLDENFKPLYYEDVDWQMRGHFMGYKTIYEPKCVYQHEMSATVSKLFDKNTYLNIAKQIFKEKYAGCDIEQYNYKNKWNIDSPWNMYRIYTLD